MKETTSGMGTQSDLTTGTEVRTKLGTETKGEVTVSRD